MTAKGKPPVKARDAVEKVGEGITRDKINIDEYEKLQDVKERGRHHRTIVGAWKRQQDEDRKMRKTYATWLMVAMSSQIVAINLIVILIGFGILSFSPSTTNTFVVSVFAEISAMVLLVVKYLFPATSDKVLDLVDRFRPKKRD